MDFLIDQHKSEEQVGKLSPKESPEDAHTVLRGTAPKDSWSCSSYSHLSRDSAPDKEFEKLLQ